ncbi:hypothetical protein C8J56DRAFT_1056887 [Mycena floridula]|nr:hypothetical protein C8J56DRAFT_1056887 [Mycena floridula]
MTEPVPFIRNPKSTLPLYTGVIQPRSSFGSISISGSLDNVTSPLETVIQHRITAIQNATSQVIVDPELNQNNVFSFCAPLFIFAAFIFGAACLPRISPTREWIQDIGNNKTSLSMAFVVLVTLILVGLGFLRIGIWAVASFVQWISEKEFTIENRRMTPGLFQLLFQSDERKTN